MDRRPASVATGNTQQSTQRSQNASVVSPAPTSVTAGLAALDWTLGLRVKLTTVLDDTIVGAVYAYDPITSTISVITSPSPTGPGPHDVRILKVSFLKEVQVVGASATATRGFSNAEPRIGRFTRDDKKEAKATPRLVGRGVTKEGQEIMDALSRTMLCRWADKQIVVLDSVIINEPYGLNNVKGNDQNAVQRVKKVLEGERRKLETTRRAATPVSGERKGG